MPADFLTSTRRPTAHPSARLDIVESDLRGAALYSLILLLLSWFALGMDSDSDSAAGARGVGTCGQPPAGVRIGDPRYLNQQC